MKSRALGVNNDLAGSRAWSLHHGINEQTQNVNQCKTMDVQVWKNSASIHPIHGWVLPRIIKVKEIVQKTRYPSFLLQVSPLCLTMRSTVVTQLLKEHHSDAQQSLPSLCPSGHRSTKQVNKHILRTSPSNAGGRGSIPSQRVKIPHAPWPKNHKKPKA